jgi:hypothetical protein
MAVRELDADPQWNRSRIMVSSIQASNSTATPPLPAELQIETSRVETSRVETSRLPTGTEAIWEPLFNDVWVARCNDTFVGMIQRVGTVFKLTDATGCLIGRFQSIYDARNALVGGW